MKTRIISLFFILNSIIPVNACTIFLANDGKNVWVGNNEDESSDMKYRFWYIPREEKSWGYMLWSEKHEGYNDVMWKYPQGGMNEYGLFLDYTAIDDIPVINVSSKLNREEEVVNDILKKCKTVKEALQFIAPYNLTKLSGAQLFIADSSGDYATIHGNYVVTKTTQNFSLTNYCIANGHQEACWRRETSMNLLSQYSSFNEKNITHILEEAAQRAPGDVLTNYSMSINLKKQEMVLYMKGDYTTPFKINLVKELSKGKHSSDLTEYFPTNIRTVLNSCYQREGIASTINLYNSLRKNSPDIYNFRNNDAILFGTDLIRAQKKDDAIAFIENLKNKDHRNILINSWLAIAYQYKGNSVQTSRYLNAVLKRDPDNYLANLYSVTSPGKVIFKINTWTGAQNVKLIGSFTEWLKNPISLEKKDGYWYGEVEIPKGRHEYKFLVDDVYYLADPFNLIYIWNGNNVNSILQL
ncbi:hypothetical protein F3J23_01095 [Chryseobacterium sp. Tr-659]|uniref:hypothetical protein n=1 Tax=Chryseobacterium sp. Tr-659 TaxID=2608340 RepID=UPI001422BE4A|nr:hypothetical protein [Chryseobacterium sp. Tr-659]NIF04022.1 hypothetical protein [Chryseobacterium sp. Tr-659]